MIHITASSANFALQILQGLLAPVIGLTTLYIAWQQWETNKRKYLLDRYERRLRIYQCVVEMLGSVSRDFRPQFPELFKFTYDTAEAAFLFGAEIPAYIDEIFKRAVALNTANFEYRDLFQGSAPPGYDHQRIVNEAKEQKKWFTRQLKVATGKFRSYLDVSR